MDSDQSVSNNFDFLSGLAEKDPEAFERYKRDLISQTIKQAPEDRQENLQRYQWRIDQETRKHEDSFLACIKLTQMMSQRMFSMNSQLLSINAIASADSSKPALFDNKQVISLNQA